MNVETVMGDSEVNEPRIVGVQFKARF